MIETQIPGDDQLPQEQKIALAIAQILAMPQAVQQIQQLQCEQDGRIAQMERSQAFQGQSLQRSEDSLLKLTQAMDAFYQQQRCLEQASEHLSLLSQQHYDRHVIEPLIRRVFPLIDMLAETSSQNNDEQATGNNSDILEAFAADLCELLAGYGVEPIQAITGVAFDPKTMKPIRFVPTCCLKEDKTVEAMVRPGFRRDERILRPAIVSIYRFDDTKQIPNDSSSKQER